MSQQDSNGDPFLEWNRFWRVLTLFEKFLIVLSGLLFMAAAFLGPHLLCFIAERTQATSMSALIFDAAVVELLGSVILFLVPLKIALKKWLHGTPGDPRSPTLFRWAVAAIWMFGIFIPLSIVLPQLFFLITKRATAVDPTMWAFDSLAFLIALLPQIAAIIPYMWVGYRHKND